MIFLKIFKLFDHLLLQALRNLFFFRIHYLHFVLWVYLLIHRRYVVMHFHLIDFHESARDHLPQLHIELHPMLRLGNDLKSQPTLRVSGLCTNIVFDSFE